MFFELANWHSVQPSGPPSLASIEALTRLHPQVLLQALEHYYSTRAVSTGSPNYNVPSALMPARATGCARLANGSGYRRITMRTPTSIWPSPCPWY
jgi:hypothetical protein